MMKENKYKSELIYQMCSRCIMDTTAKDIVFDKYGVCNFCKDFLKRSQKLEKNFLDKKKLIKLIKSHGKKKKYDCIIGVSGGVDSSFSLLKACELGLRPLAVHLDNGWNSELAQHNISKLIRRCKVDLYTHVINWKEYRNLQEAFFQSNVIDVELLIDNAMLALNYKMANKYGIKYILSGTNTSTEGFRIPANWSWFKNDAKNIRAIVKKYSDQTIKTFPLFSSIDYIYYTFIKKINWVLFPDYFNYSKESAIEILKKKINYKPYPYKHFESVFTRFYQAYILPNKFKVDKRLIHLSAQIVSNEITRKEALEKIKNSPYDADQEREDIEYFLTKFEWNELQLKEYISRPPKSHTHFKSEGSYADDFVEWVYDRFFAKKTKNK